MLYWEMQNRKIYEFVNGNLRKGTQLGDGEFQNILYFLASRGWFLAFSDTIFDTFHFAGLNIKPYKVQYKFWKHWAEVSIPKYLAYSGNT